MSETQERITRQPLPVPENALADQIPPFMLSEDSATHQLELFIRWICWLCGNCPMAAVTRRIGRVGYPWTRIVSCSNDAVQRLSYELAIAIHEDFEIEMTKGGLEGMIRDLSGLARNHDEGEWRGVALKMQDAFVNQRAYA